MKHSGKQPYRRPLSLAWRPAIEQLDQAVDRFLELRRQESFRLQRYELFGVVEKPQLVRPKPQARVKP